MDSYFGAYKRFETVSKDDAAILLGADCLVGDTFDISFKTESGTTIAWLKNRFGKEVGFFDEEFSRRLSILAAREFTIKTLLSFVAYTDIPEPGHYWGEAAIIAYDPKHENSFGAFTKRIQERMMDGRRPNVDLGEQGFLRVLENDGTWIPDQSIPLPEKKTGTVIMKQRRSFSEKMIEQGRKGNKGCYAASWAFIALLVASAVFALKSCGAF